MDDLISRQDAIDVLKNSRFPGAPYVDAGISIAIGVVCDLPSVRDVALEELTAAVREIAEKLKAEEEPEDTDKVTEENLC